MRAFPTIIVLRADGVELDRHAGFDGDADKFIAMLKNWSENKNTLYSYLEEWAQDTTDVEWNHRIAERYVDRFQTNLAQRFWHNVLKLDPQNETGYVPVAEFNIALHQARSNGETEKLSMLLETESDPDRLRAGFFILARVYESRNDVDKAVKTYQRALEKMPDDAGFMNACAWFIYEQQARDYYDLGIELAQQAVKLSPEDAGIWDTLAWLLHSDGQYQQAVDAMSKAVELEPDVDYFIQSLKRMKNDAMKS